MTPEAATPSSPALRELVARGYVEAVSDAAGLDRALGAGMVTFYTGYDPTAASLHAGNLLTIMLMRLLQRHGHRPIALLGRGTALVGDPTGRSEMRQLLDPSTIADTAARFRDQLGRFVYFDRGRENDALLLDNGDWLLELRYLEFLREYGRHFTVNRMIAAKTYRDRLDAEQPLSFLEFNYQLLQAYDFLHLFRAHGCTLQTGGGDQWGNIVAGVELVRRVAAAAAGDAEPAADEAFGLTAPLLLTADGRKMGKTERGALWLDAERTSPYDYYQYWVGCDDRDVGRLLRLFTEIPLPEIDELTRVEGAALREAKSRLAREATTLAHGPQAADAAASASRQAFGGGEDWSAVPCVEVAAGSVKLVDLLLHPEIAAFRSKREARQRIEAGAVKLDGAPCTDPELVITRERSTEAGLRLQAGKRHHFRIRLVG